MVTGAIALGGAAYNAYESGKVKDANEAAAAQHQQVIDAAVKALTDIGYPPEEALRLSLETPELVGKLAPHLQSILPDLISASSEIKSNPKLEQAQLDALGSMQERAQGGLTPADLADINEVKRQSAEGLAGQDANIIDNMAQRGIGGSGAELAMRLDAKSKAQSSAGAESDKLAAMNYKAKMDALTGAGNMAGNMQQADFGRQMQQAQSQDAISKFNQSGKYNVGAANAAAMSNVDSANLTAAQNNANQGTALHNQEQIHNKDLKRQEYEAKVAMQSKINALKTGGADTAVKTAVTAGKGKLDSTGNIIKGITEGVKAYNSKDN